MEFSRSLAFHPLLLSECAPLQPRHECRRWPSSGITGAWMASPALSTTSTQRQVNKMRCANFAHQREQIEEEGRKRASSELAAQQTFRRPTIRYSRRTTESPLSSGLVHRPHFGTPSSNPPYLASFGFQHLGRPCQSSACCLAIEILPQGYRGGISRRFWGGSKSLPRSSCPPGRR